MPDNGTHTHTLPHSTLLQLLVSFQTGASVLLQGLTALSLMRKVHAVQKGETVLVHAAAGGTGLLLVQLCKLAGATVIGTTSTPEKKQIALDAGTL